MQFLTKLRIPKFRMSKLFLSLPALITTAVILLLLIGGIIWFFIYQNLDSKVLALAKKDMEEGNLDKAASAFLVLTEKEDYRLDSFMSLYEIDIQREDYKAAVDTLKSAVEKDGSKEFSDLLYELVPVVSFKTRPGTYDDNTFAELAVSLLEAKIYFTDDGSEPTESSRRYFTPLDLPNGRTLIKAVAVSDKGIMGEVVKAEYSLNLRVPDNVTVSLESGTYDEELTVEMTAGHEEDMIFFHMQTDGDSEPILYEYTDEPIELHEGRTVITVYARTKQRVNSEKLTYTYLLEDMKPKPVTFSLNSGYYRAEQSITLSSNKDEYTIYYTTDGSKPTDKSAKYSSPIKAAEGKTTIKAIAVSKTGKASEVTSGTYTVDLTPVEQASAVSGTRVASDSVGNIATTVSTAAGYDVVRLMNQERSRIGLASYITDERLMQAAAIRAREMVELNAYGHTRPNGARYNNVGLEVGISNIGGMGENIAMRTWENMPSESLETNTTGAFWYKTWAGSPPHYANITRGYKGAGAAVAWKKVGDVYLVIACTLFL